MLTKITLKLVEWLFKRDLNKDEKLILIKYITQRIDALPLSDIIEIDKINNTVYINGKVMSQEWIQNLYVSSKAARENIALKFVYEQVAFTAVTMGVHKVDNIDQLLFCRAALWWGQHQNLLLESLAQFKDE